MDILEEIKADLERERFARLWQRYGYILLVGIVAIILATASVVWWKSHMLAKQEEIGNQFEAASIASRKNELSNALALFDHLATEGKGNAATLALLNKAAILVKQDKKEEAIQVYDSVVAQKGSNKALHEFALLLSVYLRMESGDTGDAVIAQLESLTIPGSVWRSSALELKGLYALRIGDKQQARDVFSMLEKDTETPVAMKERATALMSELE